MLRLYSLVFLSLLLPLSVTSKDSSAATNEKPNEGDLKGHMKPFGQQGPASPIESVDGFISPVEFLTKYVQPNRPLLFRGGAKSSPAFEQWTDAYLLANTPPRPAGDVFVEHKKKENRSLGSEFMHFKEFLSIYNTSDIYMVSEVPSFMLPDLVVPYPVQCKYFVQGGLDTHVAWFSSGGTSSVIHLDSYENINCLLRGKKTLVLLNTTHFPDQIDKILDQSGNSYSSVDVDSIDVKARPEFSGLEFFTAEMQAGDCLYIPNLWVHQVRSFENNLAVNLWWFHRKSYDTSGCAKRFDQNLRFNRVAFAARMKAARDDANAVRATLASFLKPPVSKSEFLDFLSRSDTAELSSKWPDFPPAVEALFRSLDTNNDGVLTETEFENKLKLKAGAVIRSAVSAYNVQVFAMQEATAGDPSRLPKFLATSESSDDIFTPETTWLTEDQQKEIDDAAKEAKEEL